ncbi:dodecin family protein [Niabella sp. CC-SYL272]|uniref:dodecin family protein n=1 Tax=Niabella agricola TaxID=2891571 RepID=UPI001F15A31F|nr:dodecin family protein [Niabella agricola]MCF3108320.1 dodecin family protein [Niabella agricola]
MPVVKVTEVIGSSPESFEGAIQNAVNEVSKTIRNMDSLYVKDFKVHLNEGGIESYGVICKISFRVEETS